MCRMDISIATWAILVGGSVFAGWIDGVIGGGGLVVLPMFMAVFPSMVPATALSTSKFISFWGTVASAFTLSRKVKLDWKEVGRLFLVAVVAGGLGAAAAAAMSEEIMRPLIIVLLLAVGTFVALKKDFGGGESEGIHSGWRAVAALVAAAAIAFYDGIFGPGTGMFLVIAFTAIFSQNFVRSSAMAKVVNSATNLGGLIVFIAGGYMAWGVGIVLAIASAVGSMLGARTVLGGGTKLVRYALLTLVVVLCIYLSWQQWG